MRSDRGADMAESTLLSSGARRTSVRSSVPRQHTRHMWYSRVFTRAMKATGHSATDEPFAGMFTQGMVVHETYQKADGAYVTPAEVKVETAANGRRATLLATGEDITIGP